MEAKSMHRLVSRQHSFLKETAVLALFQMCNIKYDSEKSHFYFNGEMQKTASEVSIVTSKHPLNNMDVPAIRQQPIIIYVQFMSLSHWL
jgi:hypothetical protein